MRQLATLPNADAAQTLADYLLTQRIETRLERLADGWAVWVFDEDRLPQARKELADFTANPGDPRFVAARLTAELERRRAEKEVEEAAVPPIQTPQPAPWTSGPIIRGLWVRFWRWLTGPAPWTSGLIVACCLVFVGHTGLLLYKNAGLGGQAVLTILMGRLDGLDVLTSDVQQALSIAPFHVEQQGDHALYTWHWLDNVRQGEVWRLITPIFLHFGVIHLLFNMAMLQYLGMAVEVRRGPWRYLLLMLTTAVVSNVAQYYLNGFSWEDGRLLVHAGPAFGGMSGVLYGLFGYMWMKSRYEPALGLWLSPRTVLVMVGWLFLCMTGFIGAIANTAHVVGLIVGLVIGVAPHVWRRVRGTRPT